jgi:hypothetical protein
MTIKELRKLLDSFTQVVSEDCEVKLILTDGSREEYDITNWSLSQERLLLE